VWFESLDFNLAVEEIYHWVENEDTAAFLQARELVD